MQPLNYQDVKAPMLNQNNTTPSTQKQVYQPNTIQQQPLGVYVCEVDPNHNQIQAQSKCEYCDKMMCLKCAKKVAPGFVLNTRSYYNTRYAKDSCINCFNKITAARKEYKWLTTTHLILLVLGCFGLSFFSIIGIILSIMYMSKIPEDNAYEDIKKFNKFYLWMHVVMIAIYIFTFAIIFGSIIFPLFFIV